MVKELQSRLAQQNIKLVPEEAVYAHLAKIGFDNVYGARPLRRTILKPSKTHLRRNHHRRVSKRRYHRGISGARRDTLP